MKVEVYRWDPLWDNNFPPTWWTKYVRLHQEHEDGFDPKPNSEFNKSLWKHKAKFKLEKSIGYLEFDTEQDYVIFVMRWS